MDMAGSVWGRGGKLSQARISGFFQCLAGMQNLQLATTQCRRQDLYAVVASRTYFLTDLDTLFPKMLEIFSIRLVKSIGLVT